MRSYITFRHYLSNKQLINELKKSQEQVFSKDTSSSESLSESIISTLKIYSKIRSIINTSNLIQIESFSDDEMIVAEFDFQHDIELIFIIMEDENGEKYINISDDVSNCCSSNYEIINRFYYKDNKNVEPEQILLQHILHYN